jgi:hypothetical protein
VPIKKTEFISRIQAYARFARSKFGWHNSEQFPKCICGEDLVKGNESDFEELGFFVLECRSCALRYKYSGKNVYRLDDTGKLSHYSKFSYVKGRWRNP